MHHSLIDVSCQSSDKVSTLSPLSLIDEGFHTFPISVSSALVIALIVVTTRDGSHVIKKHEEAMCMTEGCIGWI